MQPQNTMALSASLTTALRDGQIADLQSTPLLRALGAGWTTSQDRAYLVPILAWAHSALFAACALAAIRHESRDPLAHEAISIGKEQTRRYALHASALTIT